MIAHQRKWFWTFLFVGVVAVNCSGSDSSDEIKAILGSGPDPNSGKTTTATTAKPSSTINNNTKKLNIVVSSINEEGIKEEGQMATEVSLLSDEAPASTEDKTVVKNNQVSHLQKYFCLCMHVDHI